MVLHRIREVLLQLSTAVHVDRMMFPKITHVPNGQRSFKLKSFHEASISLAYAMRSWLSIFLRKVDTLGVLNPSGVHVPVSGGNYQYQVEIIFLCVL